MPCTTKNYLLPAGINSWGADVEDAYHISGEQDITYGFWIE